MTHRGGSWPPSGSTLPEDPTPYDAPVAAAEGTVHARAPLRVSFAGGGTDGPPCPELLGGAVLSATIDRFAYASAGCAGSSAVTSPDLDTAADLSGRERLVRSVLDHSGVDADVMLHCDAPP